MQRSLINVLYVNKQEFSISSWRSNQGYTEMHGQPTMKICNAKQARQIYQYKKIKTTLYKNNVAIWYNKTYRSPLLTSAQNSHLQRVTIPEAAHIQLQCGPPDDEQG
jgi:hypothetical protein